MLREIRTTLAEDGTLRVMLIGDSGVVVDEKRALGHDARRDPWLMLSSAHAMMAHAMLFFVKREQQAKKGEAG